MSEADVRVLHSQTTALGMDPWCKADAQAWPCQTILALDRRCEHKNTHMRGWTQVCDDCGQGRTL